MSEKTKERSMAERGRLAMVAQFKKFYQEENAKIVELQGGKDYYRLFGMFASWLQRQADADNPEMDNHVRNVLISKTLRDWDAWVVIVDRAAEDMVFETFHPTKYESPPISPPSPPGKVSEEGV